MWRISFYDTLFLKGHWHEKRVSYKHLGVHIQNVERQNVENQNVDSNKTSRTTKRRQLQKGEYQNVDSFF
jgi:hypothetical protein